MQRAYHNPGYTEGQLASLGYERHTNTLGVVYYSNPNDWGDDWIQNTGDDFWHQIPWHLIENPYVNNSVVPEYLRDTAVGQQGREITAAALGAQIAALYGEVLVGGDLFYQKVNGGIYTTAYGLGHGEMDSVRKMYIPLQGLPKYDATTTPNTYWQYEFKPGTLTQTASSLIAAAKGLAVGATPIYPALAYVAAQWIQNADSFPEPVDPKFLVRGRKCYDPRLDAGFVTTGIVTRNATTVVWTRNDALVTADYLVNDWFGLGLGDIGLDWYSVLAAATYCDVVVAQDSLTSFTFTAGLYNNNTPPTITIAAPPAGGIQATATAVMQLAGAGSTQYTVAGISITNPGSGYISTPAVTVSGGSVAVAATVTAVMGEKRHQIDIVLRRSATHKANIETLRQHFRCKFIERKGKIAFVVDTTVASSYTFTSANCKAVQGSRRGTSKIPSSSVLTYTNPNKDWQQDQTYAYTDNVKNGVEENRPMEITLEGVTRPNEAARDNAYLLGKIRANLGVQVECITSDGHQLEPGDHVTVVLDVLGIPNPVEFTLDTVKDGGYGRFLCDVSFYNPALFADTVGVVESRIVTGVADPYAGLAAPTGFSVVASVEEVMAGVFIPVVIVTFTPYAGLYYGGTSVTYSVAGGTTIELAPVLSGPVKIPITQGYNKSVTVTAKTVNELSGKAGTASVAATVTTYNPNAPEAIASFTADGSGGVYWATPPVRVNALFISTSWHATGYAVFDATKMNNGNLTDIAFQFTAGVTGWDPVTNTGGAYLYNDSIMGAGINGVKELRITWADSLLTANQVIMRPLWLNATGTVWTEPTGWFTLNVSNNVTIMNLGNIPSSGVLAIMLAPYSSVPASNVARIAEIQLYTYGANPYTPVKGFRLEGNDLQGNLWQKDILYTPTASNPIKLSEWTQIVKEFYPLYDVTLITQTNTLLRVRTISPTNDLSEPREYTAFSVSLPTGTPVAMNLGDGSTVNLSPSAGDNTTKIATTAFVQSEAMRKVTSIPAAAVNGNTAVAARPSGPQILTGTTSSGTYVTILNISSGAGVLRYLDCTSNATVGTSLVQVTVDGTVIGTFTPGASGDRKAYVGSLVSAYNSANTNYDISVILAEYGITFKSSLKIEMKNNNAGGTSTVNYMYAQY